MRLTCSIRDFLDTVDASLDRVFALFFYLINLS